MKIEITKGWCLRMANFEGDAEIGAGKVAIDPVFDGESFAASNGDEPSIAFGRFIRLMRRDRGLTIEELAEEIDVDISELVEIEDDSRHRPEPRTVFQLANYFRVQRSKLMQVAGLVVTNDNTIAEEAVRFAARSDPIAQLSPEERSALAAFVAVLSEEN